MNQTVVDDGPGALLAAISTNLPGVIFRRLLHPDGSVSYPYLGGALRSIYGLSPEQAQADPLLMLETVHPDDRDAYVRSLGESAASLSRWDHTFRVVGRDGVVKWLQGSALTGWWPSGEVVWDGLLLDITQIKRAEAALQASERSLAHAQRLAHIGNWEWDIPSGALTWSTEIYRIFGLAPHAVTPTYQAFLAAVVAEDREKVEEAVSRSLETGERYAVDHRIRRPDGSVRWVHEEGEVECDADGRPIRMRGTVQDVTRQREAEEAWRRLNEDLERRVAERTRALTEEVAQHRRTEDQLRKLSRAVEQSPSMVMITDSRGIIEYVNPKLAQVTGYAPEELIGQRPGILSTRDRRDEGYDELWSTIRAGKEWRGEFRNRRKDGSLYWAAASISAVKDANGRITHYVAVQEDITDRKLTEDRLREAITQAEHASQAKSQFLAHMSHELRTPLNAIIGFSDALRSEVFGPVVAGPAKSYIDDIYNSGVYLLELINDILDLAKVEAGEMRLYEERVAVAGVVADCLSVLRNRAAEAGLTLSAAVSEDLPPLYADARRFKQILLNLLSNAIKFTPAGGQVTVAARVEPSGGLAVAVADTGIGIKAEDIPKVLEPFGQVQDSLSRKQEGTGLGLPLTRKFVELHGGTLTIDSAPGEGTTITARFPAERVLNAGAGVG